MEIRKATIADVDVLVKFRKQQLIDEGIPPVDNVDEKFANYFIPAINSNNLISFLAIEDGIPIATCGLCFYTLPPSYSSSGRIAYVTNVYTVEECRRKGIASLLLKEVIEEAKSLNYKTIRLHASSDGKPLYSKFGFLDSSGFMQLNV